MKLKRLVLENFGIYGYREFCFDAAPLILIYGANEAGKTTALNGIRQALMGFPLRTPYRTGGTMKAEVDLVLRNASEVSFTRTKGRPDQVSCSENGAPITIEALADHFCNLNLESYESLFGFSQEELRLGQAALQQAELSEALAGGSFGGIHALEGLRRELLEEAGELFKARGSTSKINRKLAELQQGREELQNSQVLASEVMDLRRELQDAQTRRRETQQQVRRLVEKKATTERQLEALPSFLKRVALRHELAGISIPEGVDASFIAQWGEHTNAREALVQRLETSKNNLARMECDLEALGSSHVLFDYEMEIEQLGHQGKSISSLMEEGSRLDRECNELSQKLHSIVEQLGLPEFSENLLEFRLSIPECTRIQKLSNEYRRLTEERIALLAQEKIAASQNRPQAQELIPENLGELQKCATQLQELESEMEHRLLTLKKQIEKPDYIQLTETLESSLADGVSLNPSWSLPDLKVVRQFRDDLDTLHAKQTTLEAEATKLQEEWNDQQQKSRAVGGPESQSPEDLLAELKSIGQQRNKIMELWLDELSQPLIAASITCDQQVERLEELRRIAAASDRAQDNLVELSDALAAHRQYKIRANELQEQLRDVEQSLAASSSAKASLLGQWQEFSSTLPVRRKAPDELLSWMEMFSLWKRQTLEHQDTRKSLHQLRSQVRLVRNALLDDWPETLRGSESALQLLKQIQSWREALQRKQTQSEQQFESKQLQKSIRSKTTDVESRIQALGEQFAAWLDSTPVAQWPAEDAAKLIDLFASAKQTHLSLQGGQTRLREIRQTIEEFDANVRSLRSKLQPESDGDVLSPREGREKCIQWTTTLLRQLQTARRDKEKAIRLKAEIQHEQRVSTDTEEQQKSLEQKLAGLCAVIDSGSMTETAGLLERAHQAATIQDALRQVEATLSAHCGGTTLEDFCNELEGFSRVELESSLREIEAELEQTQQECDSLQHLIGQLEERLEGISRSHQSQQIGQAMHQQRGELAQLCEQWIVHRIAQEMLTKSIELFAEENEPQLLKFAHHYLAELTDGRYVAVEHDKSKKEPFLVRNAQSEAFPPERLSTGTREQLYLAIRMAYIAQHCADKEPLPVVMDDCFVNFDDSRTEHAMRTILNWDPSIQTIVLSCHSRLPRILARIAPETPMLDLQRDQFTYAREFSN